MRTLFKPAVAALLAAYGVLAACGQPPPVRYVDIASSNRLRPNRFDDAGRMPFEYRSDADLHAYTQATLEPVVVYRGADHQFEGISTAQRHELARYMEARFLKVIATLANPNRNPVVRTLRVRVTLTGARPNVVVLGTIARFEPVGGTYDAIQALRDREGAMTGSVSFVVEIYDAATNELLRAYVSKDYPNAWDLGASIGALGAAKRGIDQGADELSSYLVKG